MLIISLSTIPPRFGRIGETLDHLLHQTHPADRVFVYIPQSYHRFPDWDGLLPEVPKGVEIRRCEIDYGPATKILAAAREFAGEDCDILFCDDDRKYPTSWVARFIQARSDQPNSAIATLRLHVDNVVEPGAIPARQPRAERRWRITDLEFQLRYLLRRIKIGAHAPEPGRRVFRRSGYVDMFEGCGGVLVRPDFFDDIAYDIPDVARNVDDMWLSGMLARRDIPIWLQANIPEPEHTSAEQFDPLVTAKIAGTDRATTNCAAVDYLRAHFGVWP